MKNLDVLIREETGLPVIVCNDPMCAGVRGSGAALDKIDLLKEIAVN